MASLVLRCPFALVERGVSRAPDTVVTMPDTAPAAADKARTFLDLHRPGDPLLLPNPWDAGSAKLFASMGFSALATTSSGFAASLGRRDGSVSRDEALAHAAAVVAATSLPVSADLERCFADDLDGVADTVRAAVDVGLAGCSIEDWDPARGIIPVDEAAERVAAAVEAAHGGDVHLVLTARADNGFHGIDDLDDTIDRLQRYSEAGADVLYAPLSTLGDVQAVVEAVDLPVNALAYGEIPSVAALADCGVARISVGGAFAFAAYGAAAAAARGLLAGSFEFRSAAHAGRAAIGEALDA